MHLKFVRFLGLGLTGAGLILSAGRASAHERDFTLLRDWYLPYQYEREIEYRMTHMPNADFTSHELEFEYGINPHFAIEPGIEFVKEGNDKFHVDGYDVELRFNFGDFKPNVFLPAVNLEYEHPVDDAEDDHVELKLITSRYDSAGNDFSINLNVGWATEHRRERESEIALGYLHPSKPGMGHREPGLKYGLEFSEGLEEHNAVLGPTIGYRASEHFHILGTYAFGLNHKEDDTLRLIAEWEF